MSNCQKNLSTCNTRYGKSGCVKNISCNCAGFQYDGSAGDPNLNYYSGVVPGNMQYREPNTYCYCPKTVANRYRKRTSNAFACVV
tara:strand:+ start:230 stop:484 length:255 start_codon:yes stop_codon:yes gene_type:complete